MQHVPEDYAALLKSVPLITLKLYLKASGFKIFISVMRQLHMKTPLLMKQVLYMGLLVCQKDVSLNQQFCTKIFH